MRFVLASASPARLAVLRAAGIDPSVLVSGVDEDAVAASLTDPRPAELVVALATAKAETVAETVGGTHAEAVVVGCDSMLFHGGELVGKPHDVDTARTRWRSMAGGSGELLTGHTVIRISDGRRVASASANETTTVRFAEPDPEELEAYLATGEPLAVAGGFTLDGLGGWWVQAVEGSPSGVIGISLPLTRRLLAEVGVRVTDLWRQ